MKVLSSTKAQELAGLTCDTVDLVSLTVGPSEAISALAVTYVFEVVNSSAFFLPLTMGGGGKGKGRGSAKGCQPSGGKGSEGSTSKERKEDRAGVRRRTDVRVGSHWARSAASTHWARIRASTADAEMADSPRAPLAAPLSLAPDEPIADAEVEPDPDPFLEPEAVLPEQPGPPGPQNPKTPKPQNPASTIWWGSW